MNTGFWRGESIEQYVDTIHNPAAEAIHNHYVDKNGNGQQDPGEQCIVVYGGWPCNHWKGGEYDQVLDYHGCGEHTDILDAHYMSLNVGGLEWFTLDYSGRVYQKWVENGHVIGCWQTENGWGYSDDPYWLPQLYFHDLWWALHHNWHRPDQYREYYFHYYANQGQRGFKWGDNYRYPNYYSMRAFMLTTWGDLYLPGKRPIEVMGGFEQPEALLCGGRLVLLLKDYRVGESAVVKIGLRPSEHIRSITKVDVVWGNTTPVAWRRRDNSLIARVPTSETDPHPKMCYVVITGEGPLEPW